MSSKEAVLTCFDILTKNSFCWDFEDFLIVYLHAVNCTANEVIVLFTQTGDVWPWIDFFISISISSMEPSFPFRSTFFCHFYSFNYFFSTVSTYSTILQHSCWSSFLFFRASSFLFFPYLSSLMALDFRFLHNVFPPTSNPTCISLGMAFGWIWKAIGGGLPQT